MTTDVLHPIFIGAMMGAFFIQELVSAFEADRRLPRAWHTFIAICMAYLLIRFIVEQTA